MKTIRLSLFAAIALASQAATAQSVVPFEGGQAANAFAFSTAASGNADRAAIASEGRAAALRINSRSGAQGETERAINARFTSTRTRDEVRAEAQAALLEAGSQVFEGGLSGTLVTRMAAPATIAVRQLASAR
jgi:hypothetical protein